MSIIRHLWVHHRPSLIIFVLATVASIFFLARLVVFSVYWSDPAHRNLKPEPWMTPGYVAYSWGQDPKTIAGAIGAQPNQRMTLKEIAQARGVSVDNIISELTRFLEETQMQ